MKSLPQEDLEHVRLLTAELWAEARGRTFFITGGTGFFGAWLLESFCWINDALSLGMTAIVLTRDPSKFSNSFPQICSKEYISLLKGDIRDFTFPSLACDYIIHAAAEVSGDGGASAAIDTFSALVQGTQRVLDFARVSGVRKLLLTSSGAVYGRQPGDLSHIQEDCLQAPDTLNPSAAYGEGKRVSEFLCTAHSYDQSYEVKIARCFAFVGPRLPLDKHFAIGNFIRDVIAGTPVVIGGDGTPRRSYLYASDLAVWLWTILFKGKNRRAYNVGSGEEVSIADLARLVRDTLAGHSDITVMSSAVPGSLPSRYVPSVQRAKVELGLDVSVPLSVAIEKTAIWTRKIS